LQRLHNQLQQASQVAITAVVGMGGIGKTELALQYVRDYEETYPGGVCWLEARDQDITTQILAFAATYLDHQPNEELPLDARIADCWSYWPDFTPEDSTEPARALIVVDDVTNYEAIEPYLPTRPRFTRLLTTRLEHLAATVTPLPINVLDELAALDLLGQLAGESRIAAELAQAKALCYWLGYLPLGLELVGRYLARKPDLSLTELQRRLAAQDLEARALVKAEPGMTNVHGVASAFELSWQDLTPSAQDLACLLSCFALAPIPWNRVQSCFPEIKAEDLEDLRDDELQRFNLLKRVAPDRYQLHQLIQRFIRSKLAPNSPLIAAYGQVMVAAAQEMEQTPTQAQCLAWIEMPPHVAESIYQWLEQVSDEELIWPFVGLGWYYQGQGLYDQAEPWMEQAVTKTRQRLGDDHPDVATSLNNLANLYYAQGRYSEAEPLYTQAIEIGKRTLGDDHPDVATRLFNFGVLRYRQGQFASAQSLLLEALQIYQGRLGIEHPTTKQLQTWLDATQAKLDDDDEN
jgi:tetratricopeptide (TPR) repeat protein